MKLLHTIIALLLLSATASAQQLTEKDLLGKWEIVQFHDKGVIYDFQKNKVIAPDEWIKNSGKTNAEFENDLNAEEGLKSYSLTFSENQRMFIKDTPYSYQFVEKNGQFCIILDSYKGIYVPVEIKDGLLYWKLKQDYVMVLKKNKGI